MPQRGVRHVSSHLCAGSLIIPHVMVTFASGHSNFRPSGGHLNRGKPFVGQRSTISATINTRLRSFHGRKRGPPEIASAAPRGIRPPTPRGTRRLFRLHDPSPFVAPRQIDLRALFVSLRGLSSFSVRISWLGGLRKSFFARCPVFHRKHGGKDRQSQWGSQESLRIILLRLPYATRGDGRGISRRPPPSRLTVVTEFRSSAGNQSRQMPTRRPLPLCRERANWTDLESENSGGSEPTGTRGGPAGR